MVTEGLGYSPLLLEFQMLPSVMVSPTSHLFFLCLQGTTWTSPFRPYLQYLQKSCGLPNTDTEEVLCTHISTMSSLR